MEVRSQHSKCILELPKGGFKHYILFGFFFRLADLFVRDANLLASLESLDNGEQF